MSRYVVERAMREGEQLVVLRDTAGGGLAQLWPGCGDNCFALTLPGPDGRPVTVVREPPRLAEIRRRPSWWGLPLLFPFPGRIPGGGYTFEGRRLRLGRPGQPVVAEGHEAPGARRDYHGFVMDLPWRVGATSGDDGGAAVTCTCAAADHPEVLEGFPFPFRVEATHRLAGAELHLRFRATNTGPGRLPFGFGAHPFFKLPPGERGAPGDCLLRVPAARRWDARRLRDARGHPGGGPEAQAGGAQRGERGKDAPTGDWDEVTSPVSPALDLRTPRPFVEGAFNGLYTDLTLEGGAVTAALLDPVNGLEVGLRAAPDFANVVVWSPPGRGEVCFEPWTCPSDAFNLAARGLPHHGVRVLGPGESWEGTLSVSLRALPPS